MSIDQLHAETARRQTGLPMLQKKLAKLLKAIGTLDRQIVAPGGRIEEPAKPKGSHPVKDATMPSLLS